MSKERELLERAFESMKNRTLLTENERNLEKEISYYLLSTPEPEVNREQFSDDVVADSYFQVQPILGEYLKFKAGFRMAEKMHGIGDIDHGIGVEE